MFLEQIIDVFSDIVDVGFVSENYCVVMCEIVKVSQCSCVTILAHFCLCVPVAKDLQTSTFVIFKND